MPTVTMLLGIVVVGIDLGRTDQVTEICRDADSMYVRGIDFSQSGNQQELVRLGQNMNLQVSGGDGLVTLSKITFIPDPSLWVAARPQLHQRQKRIDAADRLWEHRIAKRRIILLLEPLARMLKAMSLITPRTRMQ